MRLSAVPTSPYYRPELINRAAVFLDGVCVSNNSVVRYADTVEGAIVRYKKDEHGQLIPDFDTGRYKVEVLRGKVMITVDGYELV